MLVVDDDPLVLSVVERLLRHAGARVQTFSSPKTFLEDARLEGPCCVLLDLQMPGMSGLELQERLNASGTPAGIVFMSGAGDVPATVSALKGGAVDFLAKPFTSKELLAAVEAALARSEKVAAARALLARLTPREREVCECVARGLRSKQIADELHAAVKTVNVHRSRMMAKLGVSSIPELVRLLDAAKGVSP